MTSPTPEPIALSLFDNIDRYAGLLEAGREIGEHLTNDLPILIFCENFFLQFFKSEFEMDITGFTSAGKSRSARLRLRLKKSDTPLSKSRRQILSMYEKLCDDWRDLHGAGYVDGPEERTDFHIEFVPRLLRRIAKWAAISDHKDLAVRANEAADRYSEVMQGEV